MFDALRKRIANAIFVPEVKGQVRMYHAARSSRLSGGAGSDTSSDMELNTSLRTLRARSRALRRDASYAKRAQVIVVNNVVGSGIGMQGQVMNVRKELNEAVNDSIEMQWHDWTCAEYSHTGGTLHFHDFERAAMAQVFEAGEAFIRIHYRAFGRSKVPVALELVEAERLADTVAPGPMFPGNQVRMGIEQDEFFRPVRYFIRARHQSDLVGSIVRNNDVIPVPADQMFHLRIVDRWPQTRGEPWLHAAIRKLQDMDGYSEAEIVAARAAASYVWWIESEMDPNAPLSEVDPTTGDMEMTVEPGMAKRLAPGEKINANNPNRPTTSLDPFMRYMLREVAAAVGVSYESLSRDYSQSNYSSSRLALLDDRDLWRYFQAWFIRSFREPFHKIWLQQAVLSRAVAIPLEAYAVDPVRYESVKFKPRGWSWIDPTKEVDAFVTAVRCGFTTVTDVIAKTADGRDIEDVLSEREQELKLMEDKKLVFDTDPERDKQGQILADPMELATAKSAFPGADGDKPKPKPAAKPAAEEADRSTRVQLVRSDK